MSLESEIARLADALEAFNAKFSAVGTVKPVAADEPEKETESKPGKATKRTGGKGKAAGSKASGAGKKAAEKSESGLTDEDVRSALVALGERTDNKTARKALAHFDGAKTISELDEAKYAEAIAYFNEQ